MAVVCVSGTNALHMAMLLVGVERDDEVLTQALTSSLPAMLSVISEHILFLLMWTKNDGTFVPSCQGMAGEEC